MAWRRDRKIYVRILIRSSLDRVWELTQTPNQHCRWDLRFSNIEYLPRLTSNEPQQFLYSTRIGFGLSILGKGETVGECDGDDGSRTSALRFWSDDPKSLIREGSGYWKYVPRDDLVLFLTSYDYHTRFGSIGRIFDWLIFRPIMGWATAWSFDRLRLWIEFGIEPKTALNNAAIYLIARLCVAFIWIYQGIMPKLIARHADELSMLVRSGVNPYNAPTWCVAIGTMEVFLGLYIIARWRERWPLWFTAITMPLAIVVIGFTSPAFMMTPFNVATLNLTTLALSVIALLNVGRIPSAKNCRRYPLAEET